MRSIKLILVKWTIYLAFLVIMKKFLWHIESQSIFFLRLAKFSLQVNEKRKVKLKSFESFSWKNADFLLFAIAIGGDGATVTNMSVLVSFLNVKEKIASSAENFIPFRDDIWKTQK